MSFYIERLKKMFIQRNKLTSNRIEAVLGILDDNSMPVN